MQTDPKEEEKPYGTQAGTAVPGPRVRSLAEHFRVAMRDSGWPRPAPGLALGPAASSESPFLLGHFSSCFDKAEHALTIPAPPEAVPLRAASPGQRSAWICCLSSQAPWSSAT